MFIWVFSLFRQVHYVCLQPIYIYTVEHAKFITWNFREIFANSKSQAFSLHVIFTFGEPTQFRGSCQSFCLKISSIVAKLWWYKIWSVESSFIHSRQKSINSYSCILWDVITRNYMKPELEMHKNTEWQEQISHNSVPDVFRSLLWSLQVRIVKESSNITKYSPESGDLWWSLWSFWQKWCSTVKRISCALLLRHNAINMLPRW